jgi:RNA polymerase sigma factor (sigma-70 family)
MNQEIDDKSLMLRFQEHGDAAAFEVLFKRHREPLFRFLLRLSGNPSVAQEVTQQAWLQLIETARTRGFRSDGPASFQTYLFTLGRNRYIDSYQRSYAATHSESLEEHTDFVDSLTAAAIEEPHAKLQSMQDRERIARAMDTLPLELREVLAFWLQGFDMQEVARMTGTSWHTLMSRKKAALLRVAQELDA